MLNWKTRKKDNLKGMREKDLPDAIRFDTTYAVVGNTFRRYWLIQSYPSRTRSRALLSKLGEMEGVRIHIRTRCVNALEEGRLWQNAQRMNRYRMESRRVKEQAEGSSNSADVEEMLLALQREKVPLLAVSVTLEMCAKNLSSLESLSSAVRALILKTGMGIDELFLRQKEGFLSLCPGGKAVKKHEKWMPADSAANLYPLVNSHCRNPLGLSIGKDDEGKPMEPDFDIRDEDKTNGNILILGNSGEGKSYLAKILVMNAREMGHRILILDPEGEYESLTENLDGVVVRLTEGGDALNPLGGIIKSETCNEISGHVSYVMNLLHMLHDFTEEESVLIERAIFQVYEEWNITEGTDLSCLHPEDYPDLGDVKRELIRMYKSPTKEESEILDRNVLRNACLAFFHLGEGSAKPFFFQKTKIHKEKVICLSLRGLERMGEGIRNAMLYLVFHYVSSVLLGEGNAVALIDEMHLFLQKKESLDMIRGAMKRVRKVGSSMILSSQNVEDFISPDIREYAKPLFSIPTHRFLFHPGVVSTEEYCEILHLTPDDYQTISLPARGQCLYISGSDRFHVHVEAGDYKKSLME